MNTGVMIDPNSEIDKIATEVIRGSWGNGEERKKRLTEAGYNYSAIQNYVNKRIKGGMTQEDIDVEIGKPYYLNDNKTKYKLKGQTMEEKSMDTKPLNIDTLRGLVEGARSVIPGANTSATDRAAAAIYHAIPHGTAERSAGAISAVDKTIPGSANYQASQGTQNSASTASFFNNLRALMNNVR